MRVFLSGFILLFVGFFLGGSVTAVIAQGDMNSLEKAIEAAKNKPTKLEMYYEYVETFKNATGPSLNERGESVDFSKDCLNDGYCGLQGTHGSYGDAASIIGYCRDYFKYRDTSNYDFDDRDPKNLNLIIRKYEDELGSTRCTNFFYGFNMAVQMDYIVRAQNDLPPPLLCLNQQGMLDRLYKNYIDFFETHSTSKINLYRAVYMLMAEKDQFCDPESVGLE